MANYKNSQLICKRGRLITIKRGEVLTSTLELSKNLDTSRRIIRSRLEILEQVGTITQKKASTGCIITILNYSKYQSSDESEGPTDSTTDRTTDRTTDSTHIKKLKNEKKLNKGKETRARVDSPEVNDFLDQYLEMMTQKYNVRPMLTEKMRLNASKIVSVASGGAWKTVLNAYLGSERKWHVSRLHDLQTLLDDLPSIGIACGIEINKK